jgi:hypothetical protein
MMQGGETLDCIIGVEMNDITVVNGLTAGDLTVLTATTLNYCSRDGNHLFDVVGCMKARHCNVITLLITLISVRTPFGALLEPHLVLEPGSPF